MTHVNDVCISKLTIIGSDNGLSPARHYKPLSGPVSWNIVIWTLRNKLHWNVNKNYFHTFSFKKCIWKWRPFCFCLNVLNTLCSMKYSSHKGRAYVRPRIHNKDAPHLALMGELRGVNVSWWRHQMETFSALLAICAGNSPASDAGLWCFLWSASE